MRNAAKFTVGIALAIGMALTAASTAANAQQWQSRYVSYSGYAYGGGDWMDRASQSFSGGGY